MIKRLQKIKDSLRSVKTIPIKGSEEDNDYIELKEQPINDEQASIFFRYFVFDAFEDVKPVLDFIREGSSICLIKIKPLKNSDISELKRAINKIKKVAEVVGASVLGMDEDYVIITPSFVKVFKGSGMS